MFLPPRLGRRTPVTPGNSSRSHATSFLPSALGMLDKYTVRGSSFFSGEPPTTSEFDGFDGFDGFGDDEEEPPPRALGASPFPAGWVGEEVSLLPPPLLSSPPGLDPSTAAGSPVCTLATRPMVPSSSRTFTPCGCVDELVRNSRTFPRLTAPLA